MKYRYTAWDGTEFVTQEHLAGFEGFMEFVLAYGDEGMEALSRMELDDEQRELIDRLMEEGMLEKVGMRWRLTPRAINSMQRKALSEVFRNLRGGGSEGHESAELGRLGERTEGTRAYEFGDPVSELELTQTLRNALSRCGVGRPIRICEADFEVHQSEARASCNMVILLDLSGSMRRYNRYVHAKICTMAIHALVRQRFPQDTVDVVGFASVAEVIPEGRLPLVLPKPVSIFDPEVRIRIPLDQAAEGPQHFTNLQMGIGVARRILRRRGGDNRQIFVITDGEPTAHVEGGFLHLLYPPDRRTVMATLSEALLASREGVRICTFALIEDYHYMDWVSFVDRLTRLTKGVAFYCHSGDLSSCIMESYLTGRRRKRHLG